MTLDELVRDLTTVGNHPKSEVRAKITDFVLSLMGSVKIKRIDVKDNEYKNMSTKMKNDNFTRSDLAHFRNGYYQAEDDQYYKIAEELKKRGV